MVTGAAGSAGDTPADDVQRLRAEVISLRTVSARALSRATRLAQLVSELGQLTDVHEILERATCEVSEKYGTDIALALVRPDSGDGALEPVAHWGIAASRLPAAVGEVPAAVAALTAAAPLLAGPVAELAPPEWLLSSRPRHLAWGRLLARDQELGYLLLVRRSDEPFDPADVQELAVVVGRIAQALDNGLMYVRIQEQLHRSRRLHLVTTALAGKIELAPAVRGIVDTLIAEVPVAAAAVYLTGARGLELSAQAGSTGDLPRRLRADPQPDLGGLDGGPGGADLLPLGVGGERLGTLLVLGGPAAGTEARAFLQHLVDLGSLVLEKALLFEKIRAQAETDALTGLPNRALFMNRLESALARGERGDCEVAVVFVDLDGFKAVNDTHGHDAGDQLLIQVAHRLQSAVRRSDTVARLGGDEFVVLCEDLTHEEAAAIAFDRIEQAMEPPVTLTGLPTGEITVTVRGSVGLGLATDTGYAAEPLLRSADAGMYLAKRRARSRGPTRPTPTLAAT
jgi:diguanylate cyclase (GGDEF)-like protein